MAIAKSAKGILRIKEESIYGVAPVSGLRAFTFSSETMGEQINNVTSEELRPDRSVPGMRGGNYKPGGDITHDFGISRFGVHWKHLLGGTVVNSSISPIAFVAGDYAVNDVVVQNSELYLCLLGGTLAAGSAIAVTCNPATDTFTYSSSHGLNTGDAVTLAATSAPTGATAGNYYVSVISPTAVKLHTGYTNAVLYKNSIDATTAGTGVTLAQTLTLRVINGGNQSLMGTRWVHLGPSSLTLYSHTITAGADLPVNGLSIEKSVLGGDYDLYLVFNGCRINTLELTVPNEGLVQAVWGFLGKSVTDNSAAIATPGADAIDTPPMQYETITVTGSNSGVRPVNELKISITNNMDEDTFIHNSRYREETPEARREVTGTVTTYFKDRLEYDMFKAEDVFPLLYAFVRPNVGQALTIHLPENKFSGDPTPKIGGNGTITCGFDFSSFRTTSAYDARVTIIDTNSVLIAL
jgi:hypothetical protein